LTWVSTTSSRRTKFAEEDPQEAVVVEEAGVESNALAVPDVEVWVALVDHSEELAAVAAPGVEVVWGHLTAEAGLKEDPGSMIW
jgi:hypothetical protein